MPLNSVNSSRSTPATTSVGTRTRPRRRRPGSVGRRGGPAAPDISKLNGDPFVVGRGLRAWSGPALVRSTYLPTRRVPTAPHESPAAVAGSLHERPPYAGRRRHRAPRRGGRLGTSTPPLRAGRGR